jgi:heptaprenyl diphosphate synthase
MGVMMDFEDIIKSSLNEDEIGKFLDIDSVLTGKLVRPRIFLKLKGDITSEDHKTAAGIELLHYASLVPDDIVDDASLRRSKPTVMKKQGNHQAVIIGDYIFATAICLFPDKHQKLVAKTLRDLSLGQAIAYANRFNYAMTEETYYKIIKLKTSSLFNMCFKLAGYEDDNGFGELFQIQDDLDDIIGEKFSDLRSGEITLPIILLKKDVRDLSPLEIKKMIIDTGIKDRIENIVKEKKNTIIKKIPFLEKYLG